MEDDVANFALCGCSISSKNTLGEIWHFSRLAPPTRLLFPLTLPLTFPHRNPDDASLNLSQRCHLCYGRRLRRFGRKFIVASFDYAD